MLIVRLPRALEIQIHVTHDSGFTAKNAFAPFNCRSDGKRRVMGDTEMQAGSIFRERGEGFSKGAGFKYAKEDGFMSNDFKVRIFRVFIFKSEVVMYVFRI